MRLLNSKLPPEAKEVDKELRAVQKQKEDAVRDQDFTKAGELREKEVELRDQIRALLQANRGDAPTETQPRAETADSAPSDSAESSPMVNVQTCLQKADC